MRRKHQLALFRRSAGSRPGQRRADPIGVRSDEHLVIEPVGDVGDLDVGQPGAGEMRPRFRDVLAILRAARIAAVRGGDEADGAPDALPRHGLECIGEVGMPVAHADEDRQRRAGRGEALPRPSACACVSSVMGDRPPTTS